MLCLLGSHWQLPPVFRYRFRAIGSSPSSKTSSLAHTGEILRETGCLQEPNPVQSIRVLQSWIEQYPSDFEHSKRLNRSGMGLGLTVTKECANDAVEQESAYNMSFPPGFASGLSRSAQYSVIGNHAAGIVGNLCGPIDSCWNMYG